MTTVLLCLLGSILGTLVTNLGIVVFGVLLKTKKGGGTNVTKN